MAWNTQEYQAPYNPRPGDFTQLVRNPVSEALKNTSNFSGRNQTPWSPGLGMGSNGGIENQDWSFDNIFGKQGLEQMGKMTGIAGDLFGLYNMFQGLDMAKKGFNNQATAYNNNAQNQQKFNNAVIDVFGSGQEKMNNQLAQKM